MFGLLYYFFIGLFKIFYEIYTNLVSSIRRIKGLNGDGTGFGYVDYHGTFRDRATNKHAYMINSTGVFEDYKGNVLYDPNIERIEKYREENRKEAIENNKTVYEWLKEIDKKRIEKYKEFVGKILCDINTGDLYTIKELGTSTLNEKWYVNIETEEIIRQTDEQIELNNSGKDIAPLFLYPRPVKKTENVIQLKKELLERMVDYQVKEMKGKYLNKNIYLTYKDSVTGLTFNL